MIYFVDERKLDESKYRQAVIDGHEVWSHRIFNATYDIIMKHRPNAPYKSMRDLYGKYAGKTVFVCGSGPSLDNCPERLPGPTFAINRSIIKVKADYWCFSDKEAWQRFSDNDNARSAKKIFVAGMHVFFKDQPGYLVEAIGQPSRYKDASKRPLYWNVSTFSWTLHLALKTGASRIVLCGTDLSVDGYFGGYQTPGKSGHGLNWELIETQRRMEEMFGKDRPEWDERPDVEILDTSYGGMPFQKKRLEEILAEAGA